MLRPFLLLALLVCVPVTAAPLRPVLVLGDSLSAAHGLAPQQGWVTLLQQRLQQAAAPREVINASVSGETTSGGFARLPALLAQHQPVLLVLELGANDGLRGLPLAEIRANLVKMLQATRTQGTRTVLIGIELPVNYGPRYRDGLRDLYRGLADEFKLPLVPFLLEGVALDPTLMQDDGLHPNAAGQPVLLANVWAVLEPVLAALPASP